jgi:hypothetical protein
MSVGNPGPDHDASGGYLIRCVSRAAVAAHKCVAASGIDLGMPLWGVRGDYDQPRVRRTGLQGRHRR